jgi:hypothetical protein
MDRTNFGFEKVVDLNKSKKASTAVNLKRRVMVLVKGLSTLLARKA